MLFKSMLLLMVAAALVLAQDDSSSSTPARTRSQNLANRRSKLFEDQKSKQEEKVTGQTGSRRRLVSRTRVSGGRASTAATTEAATTTVITTTPEPVQFTETFFATTEETSFGTEAPVEDIAAPRQPQVVEEVVEVVRPRPTPRPRPAAKTAPVVEEEAPVRRPASRPRPAVVEEEKSVLPAFRPRNPTRRPVVEQPVLVEEPVVVVDEEVVVEEPIVEEPIAIRPSRPQRPIAGPTKSRVAQPPKLAAEPAPALSKPIRDRPVQRQEAKPVVETVNRYSFENEDGSFTFGYENADGSFKEETRGVDCIVRGKYGYIDPDGVKREFTYQTGNQCLPKEETEQEVDEDEEEEERPAPVRRPTQAPRPNRINTPRPSFPAFSETTSRPARPVVQLQQSFDDEEAEIAAVLDTPTRIRGQTPTEAPKRVQRPQTVTEAPRRVVQTPVVSRPASNVFDFDSAVAQISSSLPAANARPAARPTARPVFSDDDDEEVFPTRRPASQPAPAQQRPDSALRSFTSELVFDPASGQFRTAFQQRIPETNEEINFREQLGGFVFNPSTTTPAPVVRTPTLPAVAPTAAPQPARPAVANFPASVGSLDEERVRQETEQRRQQAEQQRLQQEAQRIAEDNLRARQQQAFAPQQPQFNQFPQQQFPQQQFPQQQFPQQQQQQRFQPPPPQFGGFQPQPQPQPQPFQQPQQNPFATGVNPQQFFGQQPQPQFRQPAAPQPIPQQRAPIPAAQRPTFASGQIDDFLKALG